KNESLFSFSLHHHRKSLFHKAPLDERRSERCYPSRISSCFLTVLSCLSDLSLRAKKTPSLSCLLSQKTQITNKRREAERKTLKPNEKV
ncbi:hypothetical protein CSUI_008395, partial [Cystoisospora suis]